MSSKKMAGRRKAQTWAPVGPMRRYTRLTNAHSKKIENHAYAFAIHSVFYNFAKVHQTLRVTPAMEAGVSDHVWTVEEIAALAD